MVTARDDEYREEMLAAWRPCPPPLLFLLFGEELLAVGKAVGLEEKPENHRAIRRSCLMLVAGRPPHELTRPADAFVILDRAFEHERLLERGVLVQWHDRARIELEQGGGDAAVVGIE